MPRRRQPQRQHAPGVGRIDDAVVPEPRSGVIRIALLFVLLADRRLERFFFLRAPVPALAFDAVALDRRQHAGGLLAAHDADARVGPHPEKARAERAAAHTVVAGAETAADDD